MNCFARLGLEERFDLTAAQVDAAFHACLPTEDIVNVTSAYRKIRHDRLRGEHLLELRCPNLPESAHAAGTVFIGMMVLHQAAKTPEEIKEAVTALDEQRAAMVQELTVYFARELHYCAAHMLAKLRFLDRALDSLTNFD